MIGAGIMGPDIAFAFAINGYQVDLVDMEKDIIDVAMKRIGENAELFIEKNLINQQKARRSLNMINGTDSLEKAVVGVFFVTEAVTELMDVKTELFEKLDRLCPKHVILASNTSAMSITQIASATKYPERVTGTHWIYPAHILPMVEIVKGEKTSKKTLDISERILTSIGKETVVCGDFPPFINNGLRFGMSKAIWSLLERGIAEPEDIDRVAKLGFGLRLSVLGPIEFLDSAGLDTAVRAREYQAELKDDPSLAPPEILRQKVAAGELGIKAGKGFYDYSSIDTTMLMKERFSKLIDILKIVRS